MSVEKLRIRKWMASKGYGFGRPVDAGPMDRDRDVFIHIRSLDPTLFERSKIEHPATNPDGTPDYRIASWPVVYVEVEMSDRGRKAVRTSLEDFAAGARYQGADAGLPPPMAPVATQGYCNESAPSTSAPRAAAFTPRGPQEGVRRPKPASKGRDDWRRGGSSDD